MNDKRARIERCMAVAAHYVTTSGPGFLPYFEYLENELTKLNKTESALDRARRFAARL